MVNGATVAGAAPSRNRALHAEATSRVVVEADLRFIPAVPRWSPGDPIKEVPRLHRSDGIARVQTGPRGSALAARPGRKGSVMGTPTMTVAINVPGQAYTGVLPPDPVGAAGQTHYLQAVNGGAGVQYTVYSKATGAALAGPFTLQSLTGEAGGGDPIVLYDHLAGRWLLSEFDSAESKLHIAVSRTEDPISGGWYVYAFATPFFPDYPKYGVWPDGYYVTTNEKSSPMHRPGYYVMERTRMLAGDPSARIQKFDLPPVSGYAFQTVTPCDLDGPVPPAGAPHVALRHYDDEAHDDDEADPTRDFLQLFEFRVDWDTPEQSTVTGPTAIPIAEFDSHLGGYNAYAGVSQPGTTEKLDPVQQPVMWRLQYRNRAGTETLVGCFTEDLTGTDLASVRWFELRGGAENWSLFQEGSLTNGLADGVHRWMGSIAADADGNIALAYNVSSSRVYPGLRVTGRRGTDPPGRMTVPEQSIVEGSAGQTGTYANRYGDYNALTVDPAAPCRLWLTGEYHAGANWSTRIASFSLDACGCELEAPGDVSAYGVGTNRVAVAWRPVAGAASYNVYRHVGGCDGAAVAAVASQVTGSNVLDDAASGGVLYGYTVRTGNPARGCESDDSACMEAVTSGACFEPPWFDGADRAEALSADICGVRLHWRPAVSVCGGEVVYHVYRSADPLFQPGPTNMIAACLGGTSCVDRTVVYNVPYSYIVRAEDLSGLGSGPCGLGSVDANTTRRTATPRGKPGLLLADDMEDGSDGWTRATLSADDARYDWTRVTSESASPTHAWFCEDEPRVKDRALVLSDPIEVPATTWVELRFTHRFRTESGLDGGVLEYSTDGATWHDVLSGDGSTVPPNTNRFLSGGYNTELNGRWGCPLGGRAAWSGTSDGFIPVVLDLADMAGVTVWLRWRLACDSSEPMPSTGYGWWVDDVRLRVAQPCARGGYDTWRSAIEWQGSGDMDADDNADGVANVTAYFLGVSPTGSVSVADDARLPRIAVSAGNVTYRFSRSTGEVVAADYRVRTTTNLTSGDWELAAPSVPPSASGGVELVLPLDERDVRRFYRLDIVE